MSNTVKNILIFGAGVLTGSIITFMLTKQEYEEVEEDPAEPSDEEVEEVEEDKKEEKEEKVLVLPRDHYKRVVRQLNYDSVSKEREDTNDEDPAETEHPTENSWEEPYIIDVGQFAEEMDNYDKMTVYYYEDDDTLADEEEELISDIGSTIGNDTLSHFDEDPEDPDVIYVRNSNCEVDYEVIRLRKSYSETVSGFSDIPNHDVGGDDSSDES
jgi:hypothetical protein